MADVSNMVDPEDPVLRRKNLVLGWWLFAIALMIVGATVAVAFIYLAAD
ncbi:MAG TPA: hypothetical protein VLJ76_03540 [Gaiellaceae bacterium]|nr:hypothetical protein [Gaiellaceae bacterium]